MTNDRTTPKSTYPDVSDSGLGDDLRSFLGNPVAATKSPRTRNLRPTFRATPSTGSIYESDLLLSDSLGFPGTRTFAPYRIDSGTAGSVGGSARAGADQASAPAARANDLEGWRAAIQQAGDDSRTFRAAEPAADGAAGGEIRRRGRPPGSGKKKEEPVEASSPSESSTPASAAKYIPTEAERRDARRLFREIGQRFNQNRKHSKTAAYSAYRHDLMENMDTLIMGGAIDLKEITTVITGLEQYTKETEAESTETPATILGRWLRMDAAEVGELEMPVAKLAESIDANFEETKEEEPEGVEAIE